MKLKKILPIFILLLVSIIIYAGEWKRVDYVRIKSKWGDGYVDQAYQSICCYDKNHCIAVGNLALTQPWDRHTSDGGETWETTLKDTSIYKINNDSSITLLYHPPRVYEVEYVSDSLCIAIGDTGYYWRSTDGLRTWKKGKLDYPYPISDVAFFDDNTGGMVAMYLWLTSDGGETWNKTDMGLPDDKMPLSMWRIVFLSEESIICLGVRDDINGVIGDYILKSEDGGKTWNTYYFIEEKERISELYFIDENIGWACGGYRSSVWSQEERDLIYHTRDGGKTWIKQLDTLLKPKKGLFRINFADENNGVAMGDILTVWKTDNGGQTWKRDTSANSKSIRYPFADIDMPDSGVIFGCTSPGGRIYKYNDNESSAACPERESPTFELYPNPLQRGGTMNIYFELPHAGELSFCVYDCLGKRLVSSEMMLFTQGSHRIQYEPDADLPAGLYFVIIKSAGKSRCEKFLLE